MTKAPPIFLDHNAGAPVDARVLERFVAIERECPGNPASVHGSGRRAAAVVESARAQIAAALRVGDDDVFFCSGGTEANNLAIAGLGDPSLPVLLAPVEHPSVLAPAERRGIASWRVDASGRAIVTAPERPVGLIALVHAQSEVGTVQPVVAAAELAANIRVPLHVDAAQSLGRLPLDDLRLATSIAFSTHKAGGLRGGGVLVVRRGGKGLRPLLLGGGQERSLRPGTVSPALAAATALAIELAVAETAQRAARMAAARAAFVRELANATSIAWQQLTPADALPNTIMLAFPDLDGRYLLPALDLEGVAASHGTACASGSPQPPVVLAAMGIDDTLARTCVRFSFGRDDDAEFGARAASRVARAIAHRQKKI